MNLTTSELTDVVAAPKSDRELRSARLALWTFAALIALAVPTVLLGLGSYHWFFRDDFAFLSGRDGGSVDDLFRPHNAHWSTVPIVAFRVLWHTFGLRTYVPYQATVLALHLTACVLLRVIMRRVGVGPWIATVAAATFILFGPGEQNIIWAFQIGFTGSLVFGLTQLILVDHDGGIDWRDGLGVVAGVLSLMSSGVGIVMVIVVGVAALARRGLAVALVHVAPLAALYLGWWLAERPQVTSPLGRPPLADLYRWVRSGVTGVFVALGHFPLLAVVLGTVLVVGLVLAWSGLDLAMLRRWAAIPAAMLIGVVVLSVLSAMGRWYFGPAVARSSRYVHIGAALTLPALAVAIDAIARRWRALTLPLLALLLIAMPWNATHFQDGVFDRTYMAGRRKVIENVVRLPEAAQVPRDVRPLPDPFMGPDVDIGFLLDAKADGKLTIPSKPMSANLANEMRVRLGVAQRVGPAPNRCRRVQGTLDISPAQGTLLGIGSPVWITTRRGTESTSTVVAFAPANGRQLTIELSGLDLRLAPPGGATFFTLCEANP